MKSPKFDGGIRTSGLSAELFGSEVRGGLPLAFEFLRKATTPQRERSASMRQECEVGFHLALIHSSIVTNSHWAARTMVSLGG